jgi:hypothetical protein
VADANAGRTQRAGLIGFVSNVTSNALSVKDFEANLRPEIELLLCCARLCVRSDGRVRIMLLLGTDLDWVYLIKLASRHGLLPLLYRHLNALAPHSSTQGNLHRVVGSL